ncbi:MAG TPA: helix-turn-helix domain-containing protein, partial [Acidimicrobiia bacterium]|nr:helix-turn-helix domain-containing protein [Acidimicrobiia bacterium]
DIIAFINRSYLSDDFYSLKRIVALQSSLLDSLGQSRAEAALVGRLAALVGGVGLLNDLLDEQRARDVSPERLEVFGFSAKGPWRVALLAVGAARDEALRLLANAAAATGTPHLLGPHHGLVALVVEGEAGLLEAWTAELTAAGIPLLGALGRAVEVPGGLVESRGDALLALDFLERSHSAPGRVLRFEDFELVDALLAGADRAELRARVDVLLDPLREHPLLLETLAAYLATDQNVNAAAETLHVHPNSLRYRLGRVEELLGRSLRSPATLAALYVALRADTRFGPF